MLLFQTKEGVAYWISVYCITAALPWLVLNYCFIQSGWDPNFLESVPLISNLLMFIGISSSFFHLSLGVGIVFLVCSTPCILLVIYYAEKGG